ncbi:MAG: Ig-like domain repeat protein, partial [Ignavibacteriae bacterium]|nr:Ig-like domain repeat protein [Ignavibacteriota bacterium]
DTVTITRDAAPTTANAGTDQTVSGTTATLSGNIPTVGTGLWSLVSGTGTITVPASPGSGVTGLGVGPNIFRWTITNASCPPSSDDVTIKRKEPTTSLLSSSVNPSIEGESVTFEDSVSGSVPDGGTVQFIDNGANMGSPVTIDVNGVATFALSTLMVGSHAITAFYGGTSNFDSSTSNAITQIVGAAVTYRSFRPDSIALSKDNKGKLGKLVARKPDKTYFMATIQIDNDNIDGLHMEFGLPIDTTYRYSGFASTQGLLVGKNRSIGTDSSKFYGWLLSPKYGDALKTLRDKTGLHSGYARGFDKFTSNFKPLVKGQKSLPPAKHNNKLLADMVALRLNIAASALGITPVGFGELRYNDGTGNPLNDYMVREIAAIADSVMMGYYQGGVHHFADTSFFRQIDETVQRINSSFEGVLDTFKFADTLRLKGTRQLGDVSFLHPNPVAMPARITPVFLDFDPEPDVYTLYQNYPNPFNPTTTIEFSLPYASFVTVTIYNMLGQEVGTLLDHEQMDDGRQSVDFDASQLASGVYFYRLIAEQVVEDPDATAPGDRFTSVKKMLFVK